MLKTVKSEYLYLTTEHSKMVLSIIIVNYNALPFIIHSLHTIMRAKIHLFQALHIQTEIIVVDNHSTKDDISQLQNYFHDLILVQNSENLGFSKANNIGIKKAKGDLILFLNPDTLIQENTLTVTVESFLNHEKMGAVGVRMIDAYGQFLPESKRGYPSLWASFTKMSKLYKTFPQTKLFNSYYAPHEGEKNNGRVDVLSGAFMMVRKKILEKIGGLDERYFMYGEDIDLSIQIKKAGYENWYLGEHTIVHYKGESTVKDHRYIERFYSAMWLFLEKYHPLQSKIVSKIIEKLIRIKSKKIDSKGIDESAIKQSEKIEVRYIESIEQIQQENFNQSIILVWYLKKDADISTFIQFLEKMGSRRKGVCIEGYPYYIELASSTQKSDYYPL